MSLYSDAEMQIASIIAYLDIPQGMNLGKYMEANADNPRVKKIREIAAACNNGNAGAYDGWTVSCVSDDRNNSGMYGCLITDGNGNAIFSFRGTELDSFDQAVKDIIGADAGLLTFPSLQQEQAAKFVIDMINKHGNDFRNFAFTGHSLGGNLAMYAALCVPEEMWDRIMQIIGFDSPGFSSVFWELYREKVKRFGEKIRHYQWTDIGRFLYSPPEGGTKTVKTEPNNHDINCHDIVNLVIENESVVDDEEYKTPNQGFLSEVDPVVGPANTIVSPLIGLSFVTQTIERIKASISGNDFIHDAYFSRELVEFKVNMPSLQYVGEKLSEMESTITDIRIIMDEINGDFKYLSKVGNLEKHLFINELTNAEEMEKNALQYSKVVRTAVEQYRSADSNAEMLFNEL